MYNDYLDINKKFKASVNLEFDLQNEEKIEQYIPTTDLCDVIKKYLNSVLNNTNFRATTLSGPYGKGKSYLLLIILYLLSKRSNKKVLQSLCKKIKVIDNELYNLICEIDKSNIYFLPVIVNNNAFDDLNKNFLAALSNSLELYGFDDIVLNTSYDEALSVIKTWEEKKKTGFNIDEECISIINCNINELKKGLKKYDKAYFDKFTTLYNCVSQGLQFFSMKSDNIVTVYNEVIHKVVKQDTNCKGMFIVFDEFGAFLNNQSSDFVTKLNKIQALAEKCNESDNNCQMHLCCITHKDLLLYKKDKNYNDAFDTIAGRFEAVRFDRSLDENYQIICSALIKNDNYNEIVDRFKNESKELLNNMSESGIFTQKQIDYIVNNGFPINPIALYSLVQVSEKIAQNERSLFTFLADSDTDGFRYFITNKNEGLLNVDIIYDYFETLIKNTEEYKILFYKIESLKNNYLRNDEHAVFKAMAIIKIINDPLKFNSTINNIAMSIGMNYDDCKVIIDELIAKKALKKNVNDGSIDFALIADNQLTKAIEDIVELRYLDIDLGRQLTEFDRNKYEFSNEYNFNYKMIRYYRKIYLEASKILYVGNLDNLYEVELENEYSDGLLINIINDCKASREEIERLVNVSSCNIIVRFSKSMLDEIVVNKIKELAAAKYLVDNSSDFSDTAKKTLRLLVDDMSEEISIYLSNFYNKANLLNKCSSGCNNLKDVINKSFIDYYSKTITMNNEQVNKNEVQSVTAKARNNVIDSILKQSECDFGKTSQEATIFNSFNASNKEDVIPYIKEYICSSNGEKIELKKLIDSLKRKPYGMRNGVIPLYVSKAISELSIVSKENVDTVILYNNKVEVDLDANNLSKACFNPDNYYICYARVNSEKIGFIKEMIDLLKCNQSQLFSDNIRIINKAMREYISTLSPIIIKSNIKDNLLSLSKEGLKLKELYLKLNINNYELLFNELPSIFKCDYNEIAGNVKKIIREIEKKINKLYDDVISRTKAAFNGEKSELKPIIDDWLNNHDYIDRIVFENKDKAIYNAFKNIKFGDKNAINSIAFACIGYSIDEFNSKKYDDYFRNIESFICKVNEFNEASSTTKDNFDEYKIEEVRLSNLANTLYTNILDAVDEYGSAISNEEKALIYKKLLNDLLK